ncbi:MAG: hypothetical protein AABW61_03590 [Candidatus Aenigmatarchaeota archaeon]
MNLLSRLKGKDKLETAENYSILFVFVGAIVLSVGIGVNIVSTKGVSAIMAMLGALISFVSTVVLIAIWVIREFEKEVA